VLTVAIDRRSVVPLSERGEVFAAAEALCVPEPPDRLSDHVAVLVL
jgi:hypothetical protein